MSNLQRRRINNSSNSNSANASNTEQQLPSPTDSSSGHKVAYDPLDMSESAEQSMQPRLTIMEEVLLLGLKDKQGYLSFWNDNISYTLRGCILLELALRGRIAMQRDPARRRLPLADRIIEVVDGRMTGEVLLDEALKMMRASEKLALGTWIDLMSGETWNIMKIGYQLKQVRERLAKGLVDKGVLRTEKRNFLLFDMATHPVADAQSKDDIKWRVIHILTARTISIPASPFLPAATPYRYIRSIAMVCAAYAANVLENALNNMAHEARERAFARVDELLSEMSQWPFAPRGGGGVGSNLQGLVAEECSHGKEQELYLEVVAGVLQVFTRLDSIL